MHKQANVDQSLVKLCRIIYGLTKAETMNWDKVEQMLFIVARFIISYAYSWNYSGQKTIWTLKSLQNRIANRMATILKDDSSSTLFKITFYEKLALICRYAIRPTSWKRRNSFSKNFWPWIKNLFPQLVTFCSFVLLLGKSWPLSIAHFTLKKLGQKIHFYTF